MVMVVTDDQGRLATAAAVSTKQQVGGFSNVVVVHQLPDNPAAANLLKSKLVEKALKTGKHLKLPGEPVLSHATMKNMQALIEKQSLLTSEGLAAAAPPFSAFATTPDQTARLDDAATDDPKGLGDALTAVANAKADAVFWTSSAGDDSPAAAGALDLVSRPGYVLVVSGPKNPAEPVNDQWYQKLMMASAKLTLGLVDVKGAEQSPEEVAKMALSASAAVQSSQADQGAVAGQLPSEFVGPPPSSPPPAPPQAKPSIAAAIKSHLTGPKWAETKLTMINYDVAKTQSVDAAAFVEYKFGLAEKYLAQGHKPKALTTVKSSIAHLVKKGFSQDELAGLFSAYHELKNATPGDRKGDRFAY
jgi:hypothetical protein